MNKPLSYPGDGGGRGRQPPKKPCLCFMIYLHGSKSQQLHLSCKVRIKKSISLPSGLCSLHLIAFAEAMEPACGASSTGKQLMDSSVPAGMGLECCFHPRSSPLLLSEWQSKLQTQPVGSRGAGRAADRTLKNGVVQAFPHLCAKSC